MRLLKASLVQLLIVGALSLVSVSPALAVELPDVHVLSGETYPVVGEGTVEGAEVGTLETELGEKLTASKWSTSVQLPELTSLGSLFKDFTGVVEPKSKTSCNTAGAAAGTVEISGEYHVVDTSTSPLTAAILVLFKELAVECNSGKLKLKVKSPSVVKLEKVTSGVDVTSFGVVAKCTGKGKQELKTYLNDAGETVKGVLTANFGLGFETACENVTKEQIIKTSKMIDFLF
jgi:hypothetical protein